MQPFTSHTGVAAPLLKDDINTDQIAPIRHSRSLKEDYKTTLFYRARQRDDGSEDPDFVLNKPQFRSAGILVTGHNFGAGSSRESAVWSMIANDIRVIVAKSFADIYRENCLQNGLLPIVLAPDEAEAFVARVVRVNGAGPFTVDLVTQRISGPGGADIAFEIAAADRMRLHRRSRRYRTDAQADGRHRAVGRTRRHGAAVAANGAGQPLKRETRDERTQETSSHHGGQAPGADARRL